MTRAWPVVLALGVAALALSPGQVEARKKPKSEPAAPVAAPVPPRIAPATLGSIAIAEDERRFRPELEQLLGDPRGEVRARAILAIGRLQDSTTTASLLPLTGDAVIEVRREALFALGQIGDLSARAALEQHLTDEDAECGLLAIEALGKLGDKHATPRITALLSDPDPRRRSEAATALWRLADSTALPALLAHHRDPDADVRWHVLYALEKQVAPSRVVLPVASHLSDESWLVRAYAARTIGRQKSVRGGAYLLQALDDAELPVVVNAIRALQLIGDSTSTRTGRALAAKLAHPHPYVRVTAATALQSRALLAASDSSSRARVLDSLRVHLADPDPATRAACGVALLVQLRAPAWPVVSPMLRDSSEVVRVTILSNLEPVPPYLAQTELTRRLAPGTPLAERMTAADQLGQLHVRSSLVALRAGLSDSSALFAASCAGALQSLGDSSGVPTIARAYAQRRGAADADARLAMRDALRELAGVAYADSIERLHPVPVVKPNYPEDFATPSSARGAILHTSAGEIEWAFDTLQAVQTVKNFVRLADRGYFDGLAVHRVVPNFVIQDGDPTGTGAGGPGYTIRCEYNRLRYDPGMVGMALSGKDTGGSQWFITHSPQPHLNGHYTIFAHVVRGMDVVGRVVQGDRIVRVEILR